MKETRKIPFSPPDITDSEINEIIDTMKSGWITTGPKTKKFEQPALAENVKSDWHKSDTVKKSLFRQLIGPSCRSINQKIQYK